MSGASDFKIEYTDVEQLYVDLIYINDELSMVTAGLGIVEEMIDDIFEKGAVREGTLDHQDNLPLIQHTMNMSSVAGILAQFVDSFHHTMASVEQKVTDTIIKRIMDDYGVDQATAMAAYKRVTSGELPAEGSASPGGSAGDSPKSETSYKEKSDSFSKSVQMYGGTFAAASVTGATTAVIPPQTGPAEKASAFTNSKGTVASKVVAGTILKDQAGQTPTGTVGNQTSSEQTLKENSDIKEKTATGAEKKVVSEGFTKSKNLYGGTFASKLESFRKEVK